MAAATRAFIVRPFRVQEGIDFDRVERELIAPALAACGIEGRTTGEIARQGNIREDMFRLLVISDLVIADTSIYNANVFYELGIRHGLRDRHTILMRAEGSKDRYPFDLQTDRYLTYDAADPKAALEKLLEALRATLASTGKDSPVFKLLPRLKPHDRAALTVVPWDFQEEVERARAGGRGGDLRLLAYEAHGFEWGSAGLRIVGEAQFRIRALKGARETFETLRGLEPENFLANYRLGTIYQKLAAVAASADEKLERTARSEQAIMRVLERTKPPAERDESPAEAAERRSQRAEGHSLLGSNAKTRWMEDWTHAPAAARRTKALRSPHLGAAIQHYLDGLAEDLGSYYAGINALALLRIQVELAKALPDEWAAGFDNEEDAATALKELAQRTERIRATLQLALGTDDKVARAAGKFDIWREISRADLIFLSLDRPARVSGAYRQALARANPFEVSAAQRNVLLFRDLDLLGPNVEAALGEMQRAAAPELPERPARVVLFTGHMLDTPDRPKDKARFPPTPAAEAIARGMIEQAVRAEMKKEGGVSFGIAGGACGSDILFHEVCRDLGVSTRLFLALPQDRFQVESVNRGGPDWIERYRRLCEAVPPRVLSDSKDLPRWLVEKKGYDIWQRNNLWMMFNALAEDARDLTLIALYNRERDPDGPGGTGHLVEVSASWGFKTVELDARKLLKP